MKSGIQLLQLEKALLSAATLAALALISAYIEKISGSDSSFVLAINDPLVLAGMFLGGIFPFL